MSFSLLKIDEIREEKFTDLRQIFVVAHPSLSPRLLGAYR